MKEVLDKLVLKTYLKSNLVGKVVKDGEVLKDERGRYVLEMNEEGSKIYDLGKKTDTLTYFVNSWNWLSVPNIYIYDFHPLRDEIGTIDKKLMELYSKKGKWYRNQMYSKCEN